MSRKITDADLIDPKDRELVQALSDLVDRYANVQAGDLSQRAGFMLGNVACMLGNYWCTSGEPMDEAMEFCKKQATEQLRRIHGRTNN